MTASELLEKDDSYLVVPRISRWRNLAFWKSMGTKNLLPKVASSIGNQREAYENGFKLGWEEGVKEMKKYSKFPYNMTLEEKEYQDFISLLVAFGYSMYYCTYIPEQYLPKEQRKVYHPGLNIIRNNEAIEQKLVVSDKVKQKIYQILKENTNPRIWQH